MSNVRVVQAAPIKLTVKSSSIIDGESMGIDQVFNGWDAGGDNISPDLSWSGAPKETACYAITCFDPDAPTGCGFWHWTAVNIPPDITSIDAGQVPKSAVEVRNDYGTSDYGGACPPIGDGVHRYIFTVYALKEEVPVDENASSALANFHIHALKLAQNSITVTYERT